jgi:hypothetical protein
MKVIFDGKYDYPDSNYYYYHWEEFEDGNMNLLYVYGIFDGEPSSEYKNRIYFNAEEPNGLYHSGKLLQERDLYGKIISNNWTKIYQLCPYSTRWLRDSMKDERYDLLGHLPICHSKYYPDPHTPKLYETFYQGTIHSEEMSILIDALRNGHTFNWTTISDVPDSRQTHHKIPFPQKLQLLAQSKITVELNSLYEPYQGAFVRNIQKLANWQYNEAFSHIELGIMPQFKTRVVEDMLCKTLVLAKRGYWTIMEEFGYKENEHFIYFDSIDQLPDLINECLSNWNYCQQIVDNAYNKVSVENTIQSIYNRYLKPYNE